MNEPQLSDKSALPFPYPLSQVNDETDLLPDLENGDRLRRAEFERRYDALPQLKKAELIKGVVYVGSPVKHRRHSRPHAQIITWLGVYAAATVGTDFGDNGSIRLDEENVPQPDAMLRIQTECGGQSFEDADDYLQGPPELVVEVASSSVSYDLHDKKDVYGQFGALEYLVWRTRDHALDWFSLQDNQYARLEPDAAGVIESRVFPGLRLAVPALLKGDLATVLAELQHGLTTEAHQVFVARLQAARPSSQ
jgi:Uma2 family endonuclease